MNLNNNELSKWRWSVRRIFDKIASFHYLLLPSGLETLGLNSAEGWIKQQGGTVAMVSFEMLVAAGSGSGNTQTRSPIWTFRFQGESRRVMF